MDFIKHAEHKLLTQSDGKFAAQQRRKKRAKKLWGKEMRQGENSAKYSPIVGCFYPSVWNTSEKSLGPSTEANILKRFNSLKHKNGHLTIRAQGILMQTSPQTMFSFLELLMKWSLDVTVHFLLLLPEVQPTMPTVLELETHSSICTPPALIRFFLNSQRRYSSCYYSSELGNLLPISSSREKAEVWVENCHNS